jgi:hypothetical protein
VLGSRSTLTHISGENGQIYFNIDTYLQDSGEIYLKNEVKLLLQEKEIYVIFDT